MVKELNKDISRLYLVYQHDRNRHIQELIPNRVYVAQILAFNGSLTDGPSYSSKTIIITTPPGGKLQEGDEESNAVNKATISFFFFFTLFPGHVEEEQFTLLFRTKTISPWVSSVLSCLNILLFSGFQLVKK